MDSQLMASLSAVRNDVNSSLDCLNGNNDKTYNCPVEYIENYRAGAAKAALLRSVEILDELLAERDAMIGDKK